MNSLQETSIDCPYCGESITVLIDCSVEQQDYIEDCQICCRPIQFQVFVDGEESFDVYVSSEND